MHAHDLKKHVEPAELTAAALGPRSLFLSLYGDAPLLCIELRESTGGELRAGLMGCLHPEDSDSVRAGLGFHTDIADFSQEQEGAPAEHAFAPSDIHQWLRRGQFFVLPLIKRSSGTLSLERITVGRARNTDVVLRDASTSKLHAWFQIEEGGALQVADAGSKNGTRLRGELLPARSLQPLSFGDPLVFGSVTAFLCEAPALWEAFHLGR